MANRKQRRHPGKPAGMTYADTLARKKMLQKAAQNAANDTMVKVKSDIQTQRVMWLACVTLNDVFQIGPERLKKFARGLNERSQWYEDLVKGGDREYADEKLRQEAQRCTGEELDYLYEKELQKGKEELDWTEGCNYDLIRQMSVEEMAKFIAGQVLGMGEKESMSLAQGAWERWLRDHTGGKV